MKIKAVDGFLDIITEHKGQAKKIWMLSVNNLVKKYKGAVMGPLWALIKPSFTLFILWFAFTVGIRGGNSVSGYPRFIFMLSGYIPWFFVSEMIVGGSRSIRQNSQFVTKLSFPVSNIMTFCTMSSLIIHLGMCLIMYVILLFAGYGPSIYNLQFFYYMPLMYVFFLVLSWTTAPLSAFSKDFEIGLNRLQRAGFSCRLIHLTDPTDRAENFVGDVDICDESRGYRQTITLTERDLAVYQRLYDAYIADVQKYCMDRAIPYARIAADSPMDVLCFTALGLPEKAARANPWAEYI